MMHDGIYYHPYQPINTDNPYNPSLSEHIGPKCGYLIPWIRK
jgi:hypothetical protein